MKLLRAIICAGLVLGLFSFLFFHPIHRAVHASGNAAFRMSPTSGTVLTGSTLAVDVLIDSATNAVSAVSLQIDYSANLTYTSYDASSSVFNTEVSAPSASSNVLSFARLRTDTGYTGTGGEIIHLVFTASSAGAATLTIDQANSQAVAYADSSNILNSVTNGSYTVNDPALAMQLSLPSRGAVSLTGVTITVFPAGNGTATATATNQTIAANATIGDSTSGFTSLLSDSSTYDIRIAAPGYLSRKFTSLTHILSTSLDVSSQPLISGDFDSNNTISIGDIVTAIRAYNGGTDSTALVAKAEFGGAVTLSNIVTVINHYNTDPNGT